MTDEPQLDAWMDGYIRAWTSNDPIDIGRLFTEDAAYRGAPFEEPVRGRQAIVEDWLENRDEPGEWEFEWQPLVIGNGIATIVGETRYRNGKNWSNLWVLRLDENGRCTDFTEWYMDQGR